MCRNKCIVGVMAAALVVGWSGFVQAQADPLFNPAPNPPRDVNNPASDAGIPELLMGVSSIIRPQDRLQTFQFQFDSLLDPSNGADPARLTAGARSIIQNHMVAQQQVELAIRFLQSNRSEIIAGRNDAFNQIYGKVLTTKKVAVLAPVSLPGQFNLVSPTLLRNQPGGGGNTTTQVGSIGTQIRAGDFLMLIDPSNPANANLKNGATGGNNTTFQRRGFPNLTNMGVVVKVAGIVENQPARGGGGGGQRNQMSNIVLDPTFATGPSNATLSNVTAWRIVRFEDQFDSTVFEQVLATFLAIREALAGFIPSSDRATQTQTNITYRRRYRDINAEYAVGDSDFGQLDPLIDDVLAGRGADRLVRQAGFSISDSLSHLDRLYDIGQGNALDYRKRPTTPLLWTEDNDLALDFRDYTPVPGRSNEDREFFFNRQTIFGGNDDPFTQYLGRAFLEEKIYHANKDFFENGVGAGSTTLLLTGDRIARKPAGGTIVTVGGTGNAVLPAIENVQIPETSTPTTAPTLRKWQMILASFAEHSADLDSRSLTNSQIKNVAALGLLDIVGGTGSPQLRSSDAENYAKFADLIRSGGGGSVDFSRVEPIGKRGSAGFNPVVPTN